MREEFVFARVMQSRHNKSLINPLNALSGPSQIEHGGITVQVAGFTIDL